MQNFIQEVDSRKALLEKAHLQNASFQLRLIEKMRHSFCHNRESVEKKRKDKEFAIALKERLRRNCDTELAKNVASVILLASLWSHLMKNRVGIITVNFGYVFESVHNALITDRMMIGLLRDSTTNNQFEELITQISSKIVKDDTLFNDHMITSVVSLLSVEVGGESGYMLNKRFERALEFIETTQTMFKEIVSWVEQFEGIFIATITNEDDNIVDKTVVQGRKLYPLMLDLIGANGQGLTIMRALMLFVIDSQSFEHQDSFMFLRLVGTLTRSLDTFVAYSSAGFRIYFGDNYSICEEGMIRMTTKILTKKDRKSIVDSTKNDRGFKYDVFGDLLSLVAIFKKHAFLFNDSTPTKLKQTLYGKISKLLLNICDSPTKIDFSETQSATLLGHMSQVEWIDDSLYTSNGSVIDLYNIHEPEVSESASEHESASEKEHEYESASEKEQEESECEEEQEDKKKREINLDIEHVDKLIHTSDSCDEMKKVLDELVLLLREELIEKEIYLQSISDYCAKHPPTPVGSDLEKSKRRRLILRRIKWLFSNGFISSEDNLTSQQKVMLCYPIN